MTSDIEVTVINDRGCKKYLIDTKMILTSFLSCHLMIKLSYRASKSKKVKILPNNEREQAIPERDNQTDWKQVFFIAHIEFKPQTLLETLLIKIFV